LKKIICLLTVLTLILSFLTACKKDESVEGVDIRIGGLKGPTSIGLVNLIDSSDKGETKNKYELTVYGSADEVTPKLLQGELDIAAVPANLASVLYNNTEGKIKILAINTLGVLYIVEKGDSVKSFADLKGKTIYASGKGSVPEYNLRYLLKENGIDPDNDVNIKGKYGYKPGIGVLRMDFQNDGILFFGKQLCRIEFIVAYGLYDMRRRIAGSESNPYDKKRCIVSIEAVMIKNV
jgi:ABC-type nitrate/sulfonate/bicarbonate transport system substrate-binding protein